MVLNTTKHKRVHSQKAQKRVLSKLACVERYKDHVTVHLKLVLSLIDNICYTTLIYNHPSSLFSYVENTTKIPTYISKSKHQNCIINYTLKMSFYAFEKRHKGIPLL
jgi:hypothetical protein